MDSDMPMILPKGIVINTSNIYREVAGFSTIPAEKVWEYWHVYTTTHKRLKDPTACRLENFWWHVWGSNRRYLKGQTLAKLYEDISTGSTCVPLKGPPNRWEKPDVPPFTKQLHEAAQAESSPPLPANPRPSSKPSSLGLRILSSSASKPPPAHPILKKTRGSSSSGPKPTARFVSPVHSDNEGDIPSSGSTAATVTEAPVYLASSPKKKATTPTKKFVATTAAKRRRPSLPKKQSSDHSSRESGSLSGLRHVASRPVAPIAEHDLEQVASASDNISPTSKEPPELSEKARGKQPSIPERPVSKLNGLAKHKTYAAPQPEQHWPVQSEPFKLPQAHSLVDLNCHTRRRDSATSRSPLSIGSLQSNSGIDISRMTRSQSYTMLDVHNNPHRRVPATGLLSSATAETSKVDATGTILDQSGQSAVPEPKMLEKRPSHHSIPIEPKRSILDARFTPTPPSTAASVPLGRTKSQLTLLLEREKARERGELLPSI